MHDIDQTQLEGEYETAFGGELEQSELPLHETQELELASRLLEVSSEDELEQFLGDVFRAVGGAAGRYAHSDAGRALGGILKDALGKALPLIGGAGGPGFGGSVAEQAGSLLGLELEGLSPQDQEFETARQLVRLSGSAYRNAAWAPRGVPPRVVARNAVLAAAQRYAPGLIRSFRSPRGGYGAGGWPVRRYGSTSRYGYGQRPQVGYGTPAPYGSGAGFGRPQYGDASSGGAPGWRRRYDRPWSSWRGYGQPYPWGAWAPQYPGGDYQPYEGGGEPEPGPEPGPPVQTVPVPVPVPVPVAEPPSAGPTSNGGPPQGADAPAATELEFGYPGQPGSFAGLSGPRARSGRWVRRGGVLIVYGV